ncbi:nuclear factor 7, brain-like [Sardina pilchardus]|uniref:nuclear factor 7, brain-like n=1 Tax=Sardina pilchardus TaxID=27697 RepID=UPI002E16669C
MASRQEEDLTCPVCTDIFKDPIVLSCSHSICKVCLQQFWENEGSRECPVCRRKSSKDWMSPNLALRKLCETLQEKIQTQVTCSLHKRKLEFFCQDDQQLVCLMCQDNLHKDHKFSPIDKAAVDVKEDLMVKLQEKLKAFKKAKDTCHVSAEYIKNYKSTEERFQCTLQDPERVSEALIDVAKHLDNLKVKVWEKMNDLVKYTPVTLDPNTAHPLLILSEDLTSVRLGDEVQQLPDNPERFDEYYSVLDFEGFNSGTHCWDVEVGENTMWHVGLMTESLQRKGDFSSMSGWWRVGYSGAKYDTRSSPQPSTLLTVQQKLQRIRVQLDWDRGELSFSDPDNNTLLHTLTHTFTERVFPYFALGCNVSPLRILPVKVSVALNPEDTKTNERILTTSN